MPDFLTLEPAIDPNNKSTFLLDWELTMKCNLDCDYCGTDLYGGHNNSTQHPALDKCLQSIDFMFEYVSLYMSVKPDRLKYVVLNVYGGEALHHPDIVKILQAVHDKYKKYQSQWHLTVTTTTNAVISANKIKKIIPLIDEFTVSYHTGSSDRQKQQFMQNLLSIKTANKRLKCVVMMHNDPNLFRDAQTMLDWLKSNSIKMLPKQLDAVKSERMYNTQQVHWFQDLYSSKSHNDSVEIEISDAMHDMADTGRACCGGRQLCSDQNYRKRKFFVDNKFTNWHCSVNHFFLFVKQLTGEIFVNKDCKMKFDGTVGPVGNLDHAAELLQTTKLALQQKTLPIIQCAKYNCWCGICAPKAADREHYLKIMEKYLA